MRSFLVILTFSTGALVAGCRTASPDHLADCGALRIVGLFSDLRFDDKTERMVGTEIRIVTANGGYQASIQFGEGQGPEASPSSLIVADVHFDFETQRLGVPFQAKPGAEQDEGLEFSLPADSKHAGTFSGRVLEDRLEGTLKLQNGETIALRLPRKGRYGDC